MEYNGQDEFYYFGHNYVNLPFKINCLQMIYFVLSSAFSVALFPVHYYLLL